MKVLDNLKYTENHEWVLINGDMALVGVTDYAQHELGDIAYVDVDTIDEDLNVDDIFGSIEAVKTASDLYMPIAGKVVEINANLETNPELVNSAPYEEGWLIKVEINNTVINDKLLTADEYKAHIGV
ncbi:MAG: glycine cleavage system protein H [Flavobacteriales bacterium]|jgi:glycine cleavage system H protein|nr:glycine cleavage system protein H [Flavobacteriales bacterium]|tara:strand:- start:351 stop:731 length:381 start_codon:yes stop_codon:yes gene_type:complete